MKIVSWNMGCAPPFVRYRRTHSDAWQYLLQRLQPDVAFVQEALLNAQDAAACSELFWSEDCGRDSGTGVLVRHGVSAERVTMQSRGSYVAGARIPLGGDLNAARRLDDVQGGRWFNRFFEDLAERQFHDCHWATHHMEVQTFWGRQAQEAYQCDHLFVDSATAERVVECVVIDNPDVRTLSDHGPLQLTVADEPFTRAG